MRDFFTSLHIYKGPCCKPEPRPNETLVDGLSIEKIERILHRKRSFWNGPPFLDDLWWDLRTDTLIEVLTGSSLAPFFFYASLSCAPALTGATGMGQMCQMFLLEIIPSPVGRNHVFGQSTPDRLAVPAEFRWAEDWKRKCLYLVLSLLV